MRRGNHIIWLVVLALILSGLPRLLSVTEPHRQKTAAGTPKKIQKPGTERRKPPPRPSILMVTLYPAGSLRIQEQKQVRKRQKKKKNPARTDNTPQGVTSSPDREPATKMTTVERDGDRPVLEVSYDEIGFDRYLDLIERTGSLFLLVTEGGRERLGPKISLRTSSLLASGPSRTRDLALKRPHLVSDPLIHGLLSGMDLPADAVNDRVALLFKHRFDRRLWRLIQDAATENRISISSVALISGSYVGGKDGVFLELRHAILRKSNRRLSFRKRIPIA